MVAGLQGGRLEATLAERPAIAATAVKDDSGEDPGALTRGQLRFG